MTAPPAAKDWFHPARALYRPGMTRRPRIWLAAPTRYTPLPQTGARLAAALLALLLMVCVTSLSAPTPPAATGDTRQGQSDDQRDIILYEEIVDAVRHGGDYYVTAAEALRTGNYPLRPFVTMRLPGLATAQAALPHPLVLALLYALVLAVLAAWHARFAEVFPRWPPRVIALTLMAGGLMAFVQADLWAFHELWAGLLIALSLALRRPGRWIEAVAAGLLAALIRETAALYLVIMAAAAWAERDRREAAAWGAALAILAIALAAHAFAVARVVSPLDPASPGWSGMLGPGFFIHSITATTALRLGPPWLAALLTGLSLFGWSAWRDPLAARALAIFLGYAAVIAVFARPDTFYWALLIAPVFLAGLAFAPDALRDLLSSALDRRRVRVQSIPR